MTEDQTAIENAAGAGARPGGPVLDPHAVETEIGDTTRVEVAAANAVGADNALFVHVMPDELDT